MTRKRMPAMLLIGAGLLSVASGFGLLSRLQRGGFGDFGWMGVAVAAVGAIAGGIVLATVGFRAILRTGLGDVGHCLGCGYNLHGNISGVCPECGRPCRPR